MKSHIIIHAIRAVSLLTNKIKKAIALLFTVTAVSVSYANPVLDNIAAGNVSVSQTSNTTVVNQASDKAIINWDSFNIGANEATKFVQPSASSVALNRINPAQGASQIYGSLSANGQLILINAAGIHFGAGSMVNVGGLIASTSDISNANFLAGNYTFDAPSPFAGSIKNEGTIIAANHGLVALIGHSVTNNGLIQAKMGNVVLASGNKFTLDFYGDQLINFSVDEASSGSVTNNGTLLADGGKILVTAKQAQGAVDNAINMNGVAQAQSVDEVNGEIILSATGNIHVSGTLDASGMTNAASVGGKIKVLGDKILLASTAKLIADGTAGGGEILVGGNYQGKGPEKNALSVAAESGVTISANANTTGDGGKVIIWSDGDTAFHGSIEAKGGSQSGNGGLVETSGHTLDVSGASVNTLAAFGKTGTWLLDPWNVTISNNNTSNETLSNGTYTPSATGANIKASDLNTALASSNIIITTGIAGSTGSENGDITVFGTVDSGGAAAISWSSSNTLTLNAYRNIVLNAGSSISNTTGNGSLILKANNSGVHTTAAAGGTITNNGTITISGTGTVTAYYNPTSYATPQVNSTFNSGTSTVTAYMLINALGTASDTATPSNLTLGAVSNNSTVWSGNYALSTNIDASATSTWNSGAGFSPIGNSTTTFNGNFDGQNYIISNLYINRPSTNYVGLFGAANNATISKINTNNVNVSGLDFVGGLVGQLSGGTLTNSSSSGTVVGNNISYGVGGLVGLLLGNGTINSSYSSANVTGPTRIGGLVGQVGALGTSGTINNSYALGSVNPTSQNIAVYSGGLVGAVGFSGTTTITNSYSSGAINYSGATTSAVGGFIGGSGGSLSVSKNFWDTQTSGISTGLGNTNIANVTPLTTAGMLDSSNFSAAGWSISTTSSTTSTQPSTTWFMFNGNTRPILMSEYNTTISNAHQLQLMGSTLGASYTLANNIDFSNVDKNDIWGSKFSGVTSGAGFAPIGSPTFGVGSFFTGTLNGNSFTINNFYINNTTNAEIALFTRLGSGGSISNLGITNANITVSPASGHNTAVFVGVTDSGSTFSNNYATGTITNTGTAMDSTVAGLVGNNNGGSISNSYNAVTINSTVGSNFVGGVAGINSGNITNSYNVGTINANVNGTQAGGLVGRNHAGGTISSSYSIGVVSATATSTGGLVGFNGGTVSNSFWNKETSGFSTSSGSTATSGSQGSAGYMWMTTAQMQTLSNFQTGSSFISGTGWTIAAAPATGSTWGIINGSSLPYLTQLYSPTPTTPSVISGYIPGGSASATNIASTTVSLASGNTFGAITNSGLTRGTTTSYQNGFYYFLNPNGVVSNGNTVLVSTSNSNAVDVYSAIGTTGLNLTASTVTAGSNTSQTLSNTTLANAYLNGRSLYAAPVGNNIALNSGIGFISTAATTYNINGTLTGPASGNIGGAVNFNGAVTLGADTTLNTGSNAITFGSTIAGGTNSLTLNGGTISFGGALTGINNLSVTSSSGALALAASTISGTLGVTTSGAITQSGALTVSGASTFAAGSANNITLNIANNFSSIGITSGKDVSITDSDALTLAASTISGTLGITTNGAITQSGALTVTNAATFAAGSANNITLNSANNFSSIGITSGKDISITDSDALTLATSTISGTLGITTNGAITATSGALAVTGAATFAAGSGNDITLSNVSNNFSSIGITSGNNVFIVDSDALALATSTISGTLGVTTTTGAITQNGALSVTGATTLTANGSNNDITLDSANSFSSVGITGRNVSITDSNALALNASIISGTLGVTTTTGAITQNGALSVTGATTLTANGSNNDITLDSANSFSSVGITGRNVSITDSNALALAASTISGTLGVTTSGAITQSGALAVTGATTLAAGSTNNITLSNSSNNFSSVGITTGNNVSITDSNALALAASTISGTLGVTTSGAITQSGALAVTGAATLAAGSANDITLSNASNNFDTVSIITGNNGTIRDLNSLVVSAATLNGTLNLTAGGALTQTGAISANALTTNSATGTALSGANTVAVFNATNSASGNISFTNTGSLSVTGLNEVSGGTASISNTGSLSINGAIDNAFGLTLTGTSIAVNSAIGAVTPLTQTTFNGPTTLSANVSTSGTQTYNNAVTLGAATTLNSSAGAINVTGAINNGGFALTVNNATASTISNTISGSGTFTKAGAGALTLSGSNTYSSTTFITGGTLKAGSTTGFSANSLFNLSNVSGATLDLNGFNSSIGSITGGGTTGGNVTLGSGTLTVGSNNSSTTFAGSITGSSGGLTKVGTGTLTLTNSNNSYSGATTINEGVLSIGVLGAIPSTSAVVIGTNGAFGISNINYSLASLSGAGSISLTNANLTVGSDNTSTTYSGNITGTGSFNKIGTGMLTLSGANSYNGDTNINDGILNVISNSTLGTATVSSGAQLRVGNATVNVTALNLTGNNALMGTGTSILNGAISLTGATSISTNLAADTFTLNGAINGSNALTLQGPGTLVLAGLIGSSTPLTSFTTSASGSTQINSGVSTSGLQTYQNALTLGGSATFTSSAGNINFGSTVSGGANNLTVNSGGTTTFFNTVSNVANLTSSGALAINANLTTTGSQTYNGAVSFSGNTVLTAGGDMTFNSGLSGSQSLSLTSSGANTFTLLGNIAAGSLNISGSNSTLVLKTNNSQTWNINGSNGGNITGTSSSSFGFAGISNITGSNNSDTYNLNGSLSGFITAGNGTNDTLVNNNSNNTFNLTGTNSGSTTGLSGYSGIENITGGTGNNTFVFNGGASITGRLNGGGAGTNTLNYMNAGYAPSLSFVSDHSGTGSGIGAGFDNVNNLIANGNGTLTMANQSKPNMIVITGPLQGYFNDPTYFTGFNTFNGGPNTRISFASGTSYNAAQGKATLGGATMNINGIPSNNVSGASQPSSQQMSPQQQSTVTSAVIGPTMVYSNSSNNPSNTSSSSSTGSYNNTSTNGYNFSGTETTLSGMDGAMGGGFVLSGIALHVNMNISDISTAQAANDLQIANDEKISTSCS